MHKGYMLAIAKIHNLRVEGSQLVADDPEWDEDDETAMVVKGKFDKGMIAFSISGNSPGISA